MKKLLSLLLLFCATWAFGQDLSPAEEAALKLANDGKLAEAAAAFENIHQAQPKNMNTIGILYQIYEKMGDRSKQYIMASKAAAQQPAAELWNYRKAESAIAAGKGDEAIRTADAYIAKYGDSASMHFIKGGALDAQDKLQEAIGEYSRALRISPTYYLALYKRALDFTAISRYQNALDDFTKLLDAGQRLDFVYNNRGEAYSGLNNYAAAIADYTSAIGLNPQNSNAFNNRAAAYRETGEDAKAQADARQAISLSPGYAEPYFHLAAIEDGKRQLSEAMIHIDKAISLASDRPRYHALRAHILLESDRANEALVAANKVLELNANDADGFIMKATALSNMSRFNESIEVLNKAIASDNSNYLFYGLRAFVNRQLGNKAAADADEAKAKTLGGK